MVRRQRPATPAAVDARRDRRVLEIAGAVAALLLVAGLVVRGTVGMYRPPDERIVRTDDVTGEILSGDVELSTTRSAPLFDDVLMAPGDVRSACITIDYRGDDIVDGVLLQLAGTTGSQRFMELLEVDIERGAANGPGCDGFEREARIASGSLARLAQVAQSGAIRRVGTDAWTPTDGDRATYRFTVTLPQDVGNELQGDRVTTDLHWVAAAVPRGSDVGSRLGMLLRALARDTIVPLLILVVVAVLFLGIQDRIDRRDPKLAHAAVSDDVVPYIHPTLAATDGNALVGGR